MSSTVVLICGEGVDRMSALTASREAFQSARSEFDSASASPLQAWQLAQSAFYLGECLEVSDEKEQLAEEGIAAARLCVRRAPAMAEGHYYLALNLGQLARCRKLGALRLVREMERSFLEARRLNPCLDEAGPDRYLGLLYLKAPGWPLSIGHSRKARHHLTEAWQTHTEFPGNILHLVRAQIELGRMKEARASYAAGRRQLIHMETTWGGRVPPIVLIKWQALLKEIEILNTDGA